MGGARKWTAGRSVGRHAAPQQSSRHSAAPAADAGRPLIPVGQLAAVTTPAGATRRPPTTSGMAHRLLLLLLGRLGLLLLLLAEIHLIAILLRRRRRLLWRLLLRALLRLLLRTSRRRRGEGEGAAERRGNKGGGEPGRTATWRRGCDALANWAVRARDSCAACLLLLLGREVEVVAVLLSRRWRRRRLGGGRLLLVAVGLRLLLLRGRGRVAFQRGAALWANAAREAGAASRVAARAHLLLLQAEIEVQILLGPAAGGRRVGKRSQHAYAPSACAPGRASARALTWCLAPPEWLAPE